jgi:hypothetical protein
MPGKTDQEAITPSIPTNGSFTISRTILRKHDDVSAQNPAKLKELQALFVQEAKKYNVFPLDDRSAERFSPAATGRPVGAIQGLTKVTYWPGVTRVPEGSAIDVKNKSFSITAEVNVPPNGDYYSRRTLCGLGTDRGKQ